MVKVWLEEIFWRPLWMNGSSQTKWTSGPKWKRENFLHGEAIGRKWGFLSKTKLWNYRKTGTCLSDWWWSPKVVLKSTSKRLWVFSRSTISVCKWWNNVSLLNEKRTHEYSGEDWWITWHFKDWQQRCLLSSIHNDSCYHRWNGRTSLFGHATLGKQLREVSQTL